MLSWQPAHFPGLVQLNRIDCIASIDGALALSVVVLDFYARESALGIRSHVPGYRTGTSQTLQFSGFCETDQTDLSLDTAQHCDNVSSCQ